MTNSNDHGKCLLIGKTQASKTVGNHSRSSYCNYYWLRIFLILVWIKTTRNEITSMTRTNTATSSSSSMERHSLKSQAIVNLTNGNLNISQHFSQQQHSNQTPSSRIPVLSERSLLVEPPNEAAKTIVVKGVDEDKESLDFADITTPRAKNFNNHSLELVHPTKAIPISKPARISPLLSNELSGSGEVPIHSTISPTNFTLRQANEFTTKPQLNLTISNTKPPEVVSYLSGNQTTLGVTKTSKKFEKDQDLNHAKDIVGKESSPAQLSELNDIIFKYTRGFVTIILQNLTFYEWESDVKPVIEGYILQELQEFHKEEIDETYRQFSGDVNLLFTNLGAKLVVSSEPKKITTLITKQYGGSTLIDGVHNSSTKSSSTTLRFSFKKVKSNASTVNIKPSKLISSPSLHVANSKSTYMMTTTTLKTNLTAVVKTNSNESNKNLTKSPSNLAADSFRIRRYVGGPNPNVSQQHQQSSDQFQKYQLQILYPAAEPIIMSKKQRSYGYTLAITLYVKVSPSNPKVLTMEDEKYINTVNYGGDRIDSFIILKILRKFESSNTWSILSKKHNWEPSSGFLYFAPTIPKEWVERPNPPIPFDAFQTIYKYLSDVVQSYRQGLMRRKIINQSSSYLPWASEHSDLSILTAIALGFGIIIIIGLVLYLVVLKTREHRFDLNLRSSGQRILNRLNSINFPRRFGSKSFRGYRQTSRHVDDRKSSGDAINAQNWRARFNGLLPRTRHHNLSTHNKLNKSGINSWFANTDEDEHRGFRGSLFYRPTHGLSQPEKRESATNFKVTNFNRVDRDAVENKNYKYGEKNINNSNNNNFGMADHGEKFFFEGEDNIELIDFPLNQNVYDDTLIHANAKKIRYMNAYSARHHNGRHHGNLSVEHVQLPINPPYNDITVISREKYQSKTPYNTHPKTQL